MVIAELYSTTRFCAIARESGD